MRVIAGLKWAPEALPRGDLMMAMAVRPMAIPMAARAGHGCAAGKSRTVKTQAESMKMANSAASQR